MKQRESFLSGHVRKFLLIVDESAEVESALYYCAARIARASGSIVFLYVIEPLEYQHWIGVKDTQLEEETTRAKALFRLFRRKLTLAGFDDVVSEEVIREGIKAEEIVKVIDEDPDIAILVLGAASDATGPGPLVTSLATGRSASFAIPVTVVPGHLTLEDIRSLA